MLMEWSGETACFPFSVSLDRRRRRGWSRAAFLGFPVSIGLGCGPCFITLCYGFCNFVWALPSGLWSLYNIKMEKKKKKSQYIVTEVIAYIYTSLFEWILKLRNYLYLRNNLKVIRKSIYLDQISISLYLNLFTYALVDISYSVVLAHIACGRDM